MSTRTAVVIDAFGGPEVLVARDEPQPELRPGCVRVAIKAAGVNRADILLRTGAYHGATTPARPGLEAAGEVVEVADGSRYAVGERVVIYGDRSGLYASEAVPAETSICRIPDGVSYKAAAALPINWLTAWHCLRELIGIREGERLLVFAAASGVGTAALQIARESGAEIIACAGSEEKVAFCRSLGAAHGINYREQDVVEEVKRITSGRGVDGVLDAVGGEAFAQGLKALAPFGRVAALANVTLGDSVINTRDFYPKNARITGFQLGKLLASGRWDPRADMEAILAAFAEGSFMAVIDRTFPLAEAAEAHRLLESRATKGKVVLLP